MSKNFQNFMRNMLLGVFALAASSVAVHAIPVTQLGFAMDESGSINASEYDIMRLGLAAALDNLPTDGSIEVTVVRFGTTTTNVVPTQVINSVAQRTAVATLVKNMPKASGGTNMSSAINALRVALTGSANFGVLGNSSIINISTDGAPNSQAATTAASQAALNAGIDALTAEAIGASASTTNYLRTIVFNPQGGLGTGVILPANSSPPNPLTAAHAWVVPVTNFQSYPGVIKNKVQAITGVPEPITILLLGMGLVGLSVSGRKKAA